MLYNINVEEDAILPFDYKFVRRLMNATQINHRGPLYFIREQGRGHCRTELWLKAIPNTSNRTYATMKLHRFPEDGYELLLLA